MPGWVHEEWRASAELLHARPMPADGRRRVSLLAATAPAVVLGSGSPEPARSVGASSILQTRRRSGGGLVWLDPAICAWLDVFVPTGDPLWSADATRAFGWLGRCAADAFVSLGIAAQAYEGRYAAGPADGLVCFGSLGPGEVLAVGPNGGRKLVGISQRRTRAGSRFQCAAYGRFELGPLSDLLDAETAAEVRRRSVGWQELGLTASPDQVARHLAEAVAKA